VTLLLSVDEVNCMALATKYVAGILVFTFTNLVFVIEMELHVL